MKKFVTLLVVAAASASTAFAQGTFGDFNGSTIGVPGVNVKIYNTDGVTPLAGAAYDAQYFIGPTGTTDATQLQAVGNVVNFASGGGAGYITPGNIQTTFAVGANVDLQLRAWASSGGSAWGALAAGTPTGVSSIFEVDGLQSGTALTPGVTGLQSFALTTAPEPATIALGLMGAGALFIRRRKLV